jgi:magnesium transporter
VPLPFFRLFTSHYSPVTFRYDAPAVNAELQSRRPSHLEALKRALDQGTMRQVHRQVNSMHPAEIASLLESLPPAQRELVWDLVDPELEGDVLVELNEEVRAGLIREMETEELVAAAEGLEVDDLADLLRELPEAVNQRVLRSMDSQDRERLNAVLAFEEDTAGGLMNTDTVSVRPDVTLETVLRYLRMRGEIPERTDALFVVNRADRYLGVLHVTRLLTEDPERTVGEVMDTEVAGFPPATPANEVATLFQDRDLVSAAVVSADTGRLLGRITVDDVVDVIRDEAEHSVMSMAGLDEDADMFAPVVSSARRRGIWLGVNLVTAFLAAWVVGLFEATIQQIVALAVLMPIVASMGGVAATQTLTLMVRGLALGQVERANAKWLFTKEIAVAMLNGVAAATIIALVAFAWFRSWRISAVIFAAMVVNLLAAALAGVAVPLGLKRFGVDPAVAGGVIVTTVTDVTGFASLLGLGTVMLR